MKRTAAWRHLWTAGEIRNRLLITLGILLIYRLAANVPVPGVDQAALSQISNQEGALSSLFSILNVLSGGTLGNFSVLAMGVYPYITAQIILQLLVPIIPALQRRVQDDPKSGREFMERWTYYLAIPMAALSAIGQIRIFNSIVPGVLVLPQFGFTGANLLPTLATVFSMVGGTMFAIWLGELISEYGIRQQGLSLIIFSGIVTQLPFTVIQLASDQERAVVNLVVFVVLIAVTVFAIVIVTQGRRNVPVMYPGRRMGNRQSMPVKGTLPLLVNMAGMIPIIFAQSFLTFPALIAGLFVNSQQEWVRNFAIGAQTIFVDNQNPWYILIYFIMVVSFSFFYTDVLFQTQNYGENLKKVGAQVPGVTKGPPTQKYLERVLRRITLPGAFFIGMVAVLPYLAGLALNTNALSVIGSSLLIVVGVVKDTFFGLETELKLRGYDDSLLVR
ncbi:MAG TPA: preprotein translocase subunit SecY [Anaerolineales bacterium]|nr:preprotein translocase subunit SecY [Anaerolineales bacterium]